MIEDAAREAFSVMRQSRPDDAFYCFALCTDSMVSHIVPTAESEEGLARWTRQAHEDGDTQVHPEDFRWRGTESEFFAMGAEHFEPVNRLLELSPSPLDMDDDLAEEYLKTLLDTVIRALDRVQRAGFFGTDEERARITLLVLMDDASESFLRDVAEQLNPPEVAHRFADRRKTNSLPP
jgi:hypothetical protein